MPTAVLFAFGLCLLTSMAQFLTFDDLISRWARIDECGWRDAGEPCMYLWFGPGPATRPLLSRTLARDRLNTRWFWGSKTPMWANDDPYALRLFARYRFIGRIGMVVTLALIVSLVTEAWA